MKLGDTIRRNATFCTPGTYYSYICIADGGYTYDGATSCIKKGVPGGPDDDNDGYIQSMNSPLNTYILRLGRCLPDLCRSLSRQQRRTDRRPRSGSIESGARPCTVFPARNASPSKTSSANAASSSRWSIVTGMTWCRGITGNPTTC